jgi:hypothetical protein
MLYENLNWALILKNGKQAFVLGLDPGFLFVPMSCGEACCLGMEVALEG